MALCRSARWLVFVADWRTGVDSRTWKKYSGYAGRFNALMPQYGLPSHRLCFNSLATYMLRAVIRVGNCGTTMGYHMSGLRTVATQLGWPNTRPPGALDFRLLNNIAKKLVLMYPSGLSKRLPVRLHHLGRILDAMQARSASASLDDRRLWAFQWLVFNVSHQGCLRVMELVGLRAQDVTFQFDDPSSALPSGCRIELFYTKTSTTAEPFIVHYLAGRTASMWWRSCTATCAHGGFWTPPVAASFCSTSPSPTRLRAAPARSCLRRPPTPPQWPSICATGWAATGQASPAELPRYSAHSLRHGGCTDLLNSGVPLDVVMLQGRWRSISWLTYRHETDGTKSHLLVMRAGSEGLTAASAGTLSVPPAPARRRLATEVPVASLGRDTTLLAALPTPRE